MIRSFLHTTRFKRGATLVPLLPILFILISGLGYAQQSVEELERRLPFVSGEEKVNLLNQLADSSFRSSIGKSADYAHQALTLSRSLNFRFGEAVALRTIGISYYRKNNLEHADISFSQALGIFHELNDSVNLCKIYNDIGLMYWRKEEYITAYKNFRNSLHIAKVKGLQLEAGQSLNFIGLIYLKWSEFSSALDYFTQALTIKEALHDDFETGITLNNIANIYNEFNRPEEAILYATKCMRFADNFSNKYVLGRALNNLGVSYFKKKDYAKAVKYQTKSLEIKLAKNDSTGVAYSLSDLGEIYFATKDYAKSFKYFNDALQIWKSLNDSYGISKTSLNLGKVYMAQGYRKEAESFLNYSLNESKKIGNKKNTALVYEALAGLYEKQADYKTALHMHRLYSEVMDSLLNTATSDKIAELRVIKEIDEKEKEVELLTKEKRIQSLEIEEQSANNTILFIGTFTGILITILLFIRFVKIRRLKILLEEKNRDISQKSKLLEEANAAKDKFFSIIAHDLKSPFTGLLGYSEILSDEFDSLSPEERIKTAAYLKNLISRVYILIENLLDWSRIQTGRIEITPVALHLKEEIPEVITLLLANAEKKNIKILNNVLEPAVIKADKFSFRSIIQNLVSNAIKFTNVDGHIIISAYEKENTVTLSVKDDGIGIEVDLLENIFSMDVRHTRKGTADEAGTGLGLMLCKELAEKNGGGISITSTLGSGTTISVTFPKA